MTALIVAALAVAFLVPVWWQYRTEEARADRWEGEALLWKRHARQLEANLELARAVDLAWPLPVVEQDAVVLELGRPWGGVS